jgi:serine/threonine protein kinase
MEDEHELEAQARTRIGTVLREKYRLDAILGVGGMAVVYKATHRNKAEAAVKMLHPELCARQSVRTRFLREGYAANSVKHPGAVRVVDDDVAEDGAAFLVMELLYGISADHLLEQPGGPPPLGVTLAIGLQLLDVLAAAHANGIVHRDVKPANLFLTAPVRCATRSPRHARKRASRRQGAR